MKIWDPRYECMDRPTLQGLQLQRLRETVSRAYHLVPYYRKAMEQTGLKPEHICQLADAAKLPFTDIEVLRSNYPYGLLAVPLREVVRLHASPDTDGKSAAVGFTRQDLTTWSELVARVAAMTGITDQEMMQITCGYGLGDLLGPGICGACLSKNGLHINEDHFLAEIIDPETGRVLGPGQEGELVLTTLTMAAQPMIRYRTGNITVINRDPCRCGRTTVRID